MDRRVSARSYNAMKRYRLQMMKHVFHENSTDLKLRSKLCGRKLTNVCLPLHVLLSLLLKESAPTTSTTENVRRYRN